jgi:hypothetical protein
MKDEANAILPANGSGEPETVEEPNPWDDILR